MLQIYNIHFYNTFKKCLNQAFFFRKEQCQRLFKMERGVKYRDAAKTSIIPVKNIDPDQELLKKPEWMKIKLTI